MRFLSAVALVALASFATAQNTTANVTGTATTGAPANNNCGSNFYAYQCLNDPSGACKWCSYYYPSRGYDGSGYCYANTTACGTSYNTTMTNPCPASTSQTACTTNPLCGWCASTSKCVYAGFGTSASAGSSACAGVNLVRATLTCAAATSKVDCYNLPYSTCYWCNSACTTSFCTADSSSDCSLSYSRSTCTAQVTSDFYNVGIACGYCSNYYGTGLGACLSYSSSMPAACYGTSSSWTYNNAWSGDAALALAVGLVGAVLIIVIVIPLVCVSCIIGCSVYFCCIRPNRQTTVVVQGGSGQPYVPMNSQVGKV